MVKLINYNIDAIALYVQEDIPFDEIEIIFRFNPKDEFQSASKIKKEKEEQILFLLVEPIFSKLIYMEKGEVRAILYKNGEKVLETKAYNNQKSNHIQKGIIKTIRKNLFIVAKQITGTRILLFKKLKGKQCPVCWDEDLNSSNNTSCPECGGIGFVDRYSEPIVTWGSFISNQPSFPTLGNMEGMDINNPNLGASMSLTILPDIPLVPRDLVYVDTESVFGIVAHISGSYLNSTMVTQKVVINEMGTDTNFHSSVKESLLKKVGEINGIREQ